MQSDKLNGLIIALPTPLSADEDIDIVSLCKLLDFVINEGADGVMVAGTMGEGTALTDVQRLLLVETAINHCAGKIPVLATVSAVSTRRCIEFAKVADKLGADYLVCTAPFYNRFPDPDSMLLHMEKLGDATETPLIFYNAPGFTGNLVDVNTMEHILNMERVVGVKDSSGNFRDFSELLRRYPDRNRRPGTIMQGDESMFDASLLLGADGMVSGGGVCFINLLKRLYEACMAGDKATACTIQQHFFASLNEILGPNKSRDWLFHIKKRLVDLELIDHACVTAPFLTTAD